MSETVQSGSQQRMVIPRELEPSAGRTSDAARSGVGGAIVWVRAKLVEAEKSVRAREQMEEGYRTGTDAEWEAAAKMHPSTANEPRMTKADRLKESATQGRIAVKCRRDVEMLKLVLALIEGGGGAELGADNGTCEPKGGAQGYNDPKLSDCGGRRGSCAVGLRGAGAVTPGAVRCSAWLGDVGVM